MYATLSEQNGNVNLVTLYIVSRFTEFISKKPILIIDASVLLYYIRQAMCVLIYNIILILFILYIFIFLARIIFL